MNGNKTDNALGYQALEYQALEYQRSDNLELFEPTKELATEWQRRTPHPGYRRVELPRRW